MKTITIFFGLILLVSGVWAQEAGKTQKIVKGKVIDEASLEPVSYTNIGLEGTYFGTASDAEGNFELKIPDDLSAKNVFFSAVGFKNKTFPVSDLFEKEFNVIKLQSQSYDIGNIDVAAQSKVLIRILRMASENIPYNFLAGPFNLVCSYENTVITDDTLHTDQKANVVIYDKNGYTNPGKQNAFESVKYTFEKATPDASDYRFSTGINNLDELLGLDWVRSGSSVLNPALISEFKLSLSEEPVIDGKNCWVIVFSQNKPTLAVSGDFYATSFEGKITVAKEDYSVIKIEGKVKSVKNSLQGRSVAVSDESVKVRKNVAYDFSVLYSGLKPSEISLHKTYECDGQQIQEDSKLIIDRVQTTNITALKTRDYFSGK